MLLGARFSRGTGNGGLPSSALPEDKLDVGSFLLAGNEPAWCGMAQRLRATGRQRHEGRNGQQSCSPRALRRLATGTDPVEVRAARLANGRPFGISTADLRRHRPWPTPADGFGTYPACSSAESAPDCCCGRDRATCTPSIAVCVLLTLLAPVGRKSRASVDDRRIMSPACWRIPTAVSTCVNARLITATGGDLAAYLPRSGSESHSEPAVAGL